MQAGELVEMLNRHYVPEGRPPAGLFASEVGSPCGRRRADALWMPFTRSGGSGLVGHEIKVSRADVMVELSDATKSEPWAQFCDRWWLVVSDPALVDGLEIPEAWGIMSPPSGRRTRSMTVIRKAPQLHPMDASPGIRRLLAWNFHRTATALDEARRNSRYHAGQVERLSEQLAEARTGQAGSPHAKRVARIIHIAEDRAKRESIWHVDDNVIVDAIVDAAAVHEATTAARDRLAALVKAIDDPLSYAKAAVVKALDGAR